MALIPGFVPPPQAVGAPYAAPRFAPPHGAPPSFGYAPQPVMQPNQFVPPSSGPPPQMMQMPPQGPPPMNNIAGHVPSIMARPNAAPFIAPPPVQYAPPVVVAQPATNPVQSQPPREEDLNKSVYIRSRGTLTGKGLMEIQNLIDSFKALMCKPNYDRFVQVGYTFLEFKWREPAERAIEKINKQGFLEAKWATRRSASQTQSASQNQNAPKRDSHPAPRERDYDVSREEEKDGLQSMKNSLLEFAAHRMPKNEEAEAVKSDAAAQPAMTREQQTQMKDYYVKYYSAYGYDKAQMEDYFEKYFKALSAAPAAPAVPAESAALTAPESAPSPPPAQEPPAPPTSSSLMPSPSMQQMMQPSMGMGGMGMGSMGMGMSGMGMGMGMGGIGMGMGMGGVGMGGMNQGMMKQMPLDVAQANAPRNTPQQSAPQPKQNTPQPQEGQQEQEKSAIPASQAMPVQRTPDKISDLPMPNMSMVSSIASKPLGMPPNVMSSNPMGRGGPMGQMGGMPMGMSGMMGGPMMGRGMGMGGPMNPGMGGPMNPGMGMGISNPVGMGNMMSQGGMGRGRMPMNNMPPPQSLSSQGPSMGPETLQKPQQNMPGPPSGPPPSSQQQNAPAMNPERMNMIQNAPAHNPHRQPMQNQQHLEPLPLPNQGPPRNQGPPHNQGPQNRGHGNKTPAQLNLPSEARDIQAPQSAGPTINPARMAMMRQ